MDDNLEAPLRRPTYDDLLAENARLKIRVAQLERRVEKLLRLVEKLRGEGKRQAAPFRKQDQPAAEPKQPGPSSRAASPVEITAVMHIAVCRRELTRPIGCHCRSPVLTAAGDA